MHNSQTSSESFKIPRLLREQDFLRHEKGGGGGGDNGLQLSRSSEDDDRKRENFESSLEQWF